MAPGRTLLEWDTREANFSRKCRNVPVKNKVVKGEWFKCQEKHLKPLQLAFTPQRELQAHWFRGAAEMSAWVGALA